MGSEAQENEIFNSDIRHTNANTANFSEVEVTAQKCWLDSPAFRALNFGI
jgi:hypothetical protein